MKLIIFVLLVSVVLTLDPAVCFGQHSGPNDHRIDPVRVGDAIEVRSFNDWHPGKVLSFADGRAEVDYADDGYHRTAKFSVGDMRFPNGEGHWMIWKAPRKKIEVQGRYLTRSETDVTIIQSDGTELVISIDDLDSKIKSQVRKTPLPGEENHINGADPVRQGDHVLVNSFSKWYEGAVEGIDHGRISVTYDRSGSTKTEDFSLDQIRFPNGEGFWRKWSDSTGKFSMVGRYISRTKTDVTIRKEDGAEITLPIKRLASAVRRDVKKRPITGKENLIDGVNPLRIGDKVQVKTPFEWVEGVVVESGVGKALVERPSEGETGKEVYRLDAIRFPNGEGHWQKWKSNSGDFEIVARYLNRDRTHVMLRKEDGATIRVLTEHLDTKRKRQVEKAVVMSELPDQMEFDRSPQTPIESSDAPDFASVALPSASSVADLSPPKEGGFGFSLENGDSVSAVVAGDDPDQWVAIGTYPGKRYDGYPLTRMYWAKPGEKKMKPGPGFRDDERVVDYSHQQQRVITLQFSKGTWPQPVAFCSYRLAPGEMEATPESRWDVSDLENSFWQGANYLARLVGDNQLLLANEYTLSLYDFGSGKIVYQIDDLQSNHFTLHPSKEYFLLQRGSWGLTLHKTDTGETVAIQDDINSPTGVGFSQDGRKVVAVESKYISVWDITQNTPVKKLRSRNLSSVRPFYGTRTRVSLLNDTWLWSNSLLYSIDKELVVWNYATSGVKVAESEMLGDRLLITGTQSWRDGINLLIGVAKVPHKNAIDEIEKVDAASMIMVSQGVGVKVVATGNSIVQESLDAVMKANGWRNDPDSEIVLSGSAQRGKSQSQSYQQNDRFGRRAAGTETFTLSYTPWVQDIRVSFRGKSAWRISTSTGPPGGATNIAALNKAMGESNRPTYSLFENLKIPAELVYPVYTRGLGRTAITSGGFNDTVYKAPDIDNPPEKK